MLEDVDIENFRGFTRLRHSGFTRVNLVVGRNNSGKTALLEALEALVSADSPYLLYRSSIERGETRQHRSKDEGIAVDVRHWFHGHRLEVGTKFRISTALLGGAPAWLERTIVDDPERDLGLGITLDRDVGRPPRMPLVLPISNDGFLGAAAPEAIQSFGESLNPPVAFRTTRRLAVSDLSAAWSKVVLTTAEDQVVDALRILDSSVERLAITGSNGDASAQLRLRGEPLPVPLTSMGEGMTRMLSLALALVAARGGYVFLDEIETGLHYSAHRAMWRLVLQMAEDLSVQVFATTHSKDCLEAIAEIHRADPKSTNALTVHRLDEGGSRAVRMTAEVIEGTLEGSVEVR